MHACVEQVVDTYSKLHHDGLIIENESKEQHDEINFKSCSLGKFAGAGRMCRNPQRA
jgi:hypothetical protein